MLQNAESVRGKVSTVGIARAGTKSARIGGATGALGRDAGVSARPDANPPLTWRHDGRPVLGDMVTWTDMET